MPVNIGIEKVQADDGEKDDPSVEKRRKRTKVANLEEGTGKGSNKKKQKKE